MGAEKRVLQLLEKGNVLTKSELLSVLARERLTSGEAAVSKLKSQGLVDFVQNLGNCVVITKKGMRALKGE